MPPSLSVSPEQFVFCERGKIERLSAASESCFQVVSGREELVGYRVVIIKDWLLNKARYVTNLIRMRFFFLLFFCRQVSSVMFEWG